MFVSYLQPNNQFSVDMEGFGNDTFQLSPQYGTGSLVLSLAVKKEANLDYEKRKYRHMELAVSASCYLLLFLLLPIN